MQFISHERPALSTREKGKAKMDGDHDSASFQVQYSPSSLYHPSPLSPSLHSTVTVNSRKSRSSIIIAASDALNTFKFGRRSKSVRQAKAPVLSTNGLILPDVIEISAATSLFVPDEDVHERDRLRDVAAQSIGLGPALLHSVEDSHDDEDQRSVAQSRNYAAAATADVDSMDTDTLHTLPPSPVIQPSSAPKALLHLTHSRTNSSSFSPTTTSNTTASITAPPIPAFPTTPANLASVIQKSAVLPKFYPPSSLRIFSLNGKQWKQRHIVLTAPPSFSFRASYLHLFKATKKGNDETSRELELERLEINEDSVVFVADEELVGGRKGVIKVGGVDVGAAKKRGNDHENGHQTMWILQIVNRLEAQNWIEMIKHNILQFRSMKAGLGSLKQSIGGIEPKGDMDVMLSMRAQNLYAPPQSPTSSTSLLSRRSTISRPATAPQSSITSSSPSAQSSLNKPASPTPPSPSHSRALKGLFTNRPRSPSAASISDSILSPDDSFSGAGNNLLRMKSGHSSTGLEPSQILDRKISPSSWSSNRSEQSTSALTSLDRAVSSLSHTPSRVDRSERTLSLQVPLQPPPRKRWTSIGSPIPQERILEVNGHGRPSHEARSEIYSNARANGSLSAVGFGCLMESGSSDRASALSTPRAPSVQSIAISAHSGSTHTSVDKLSPASTNRPSLENKRSSRRWSRQSTLPRRMTPPSIPPPAAPSQSPQRSSPQSLRIQQPSVHPYANAGALDEDRPTSPDSTHSNASGRSVISGLPNFSKRASISSAVSAGTNSSHSIISTSSPATGKSQMFLTPSGINGHHSRAGSSHRVSMPPQRGPAPTFALPPAPSETRRRDSDPTVPSAAVKAGTPGKSAFRDRAVRLSLMAPKPPPSSLLPPRPNDMDSTHTQPGSSAPEPLSSIPASPIPEPQPSSLTVKLASSNTSRHTSIKKRLRILSSPSTSSAQPTPNSISSQLSQPLRSSLQLERNSSNSSFPSVPGTPIGEHIAPPHIQNDPSFIQAPLSSSLSSSYFPENVDKPSIPISPNPARALSTPPLPPPELEETYPELQSLSPPPRRASKQLSVLEVKKVPLEEVSEDSAPQDETTDEMAAATYVASTNAGEGHENEVLLSKNLSRHGSVISLGIVTM